MNKEFRKIHLVRHGESTWNRERRVQSNRAPITLSPVGEEQARLLGERLETLPFDQVFCSDVDRAVQTARIALGDSYPIIFSPELREISFGEWEGMTVSEIRESSPGDLEKWFRHPSSVVIRGAEEYSAFHHRIVRAMEEIIDSTTGDLLVISHGGVICTWLTHILRMDPDDLWSFSLPNTSLTTIMLDFRPRIRLLGDSSHLRGKALGFDGMPSAIQR
ncbi:MAG: histidine phosphatase family protein [Candidatus Krumholzibacteriota bacterium]|nr:histidine phosphatase family protein [Candidatus Krumholzibacteriota bacterium]